LFYSCQKFSESVGGVLFLSKILRKWSGGFIFVRKLSWIIAPKRLKIFARLRRENSHFTLEIPIYLKIYPKIFRAPSARRIFNDATIFSSDSRKVEWGFYFCLQILESEWGFYFSQISISKKLRGGLFLSKNLRKVRGGGI